MEQPAEQVAAPIEAPIEAEANEQSVAVENNGEQASEPVPAQQGTQLSPEAALIEQLQAALAAEKARADELMDKWQRAAADFQNSRRRLERQQADEIEQANGQLIKRLLPVADDLELAFNNLPANQEGSEGAWMGGFRQIQRKLSTLLEDQGVVAISPEGAFDPARHEAVMSEPSESVASGHIIATLRTGYEYRGRVLRPALVRIAS